MSSLKRHEANESIYFYTFCFKNTFRTIAFNNSVSCIFATVQYIIRKKFESIQRNIFGLGFTFWNSSRITVRSCFRNYVKSLLHAHALRIFGTFFYLFDCEPHYYYSHHPASKGNNPLILGDFNAHHELWNSVLGRSTLTKQIACSKLYTVKLPHQNRRCMSHCVTWSYCFATRKDFWPVIPDFCRAHHSLREQFKALCHPTCWSQTESHGNVETAGYSKSCVPHKSPQPIDSHHYGYQSQEN